MNTGINNGKAKAPAAVESPRESDERGARWMLWVTLILIPVALVTPVVMSTLMARGVYTASPQLIGGFVLKYDKVPVFGGAALGEGVYFATPGKIRFHGGGYWPIAIATITPDEAPYYFLDPGPQIVMASLGGALTSPVTSPTPIFSGVTLERYPLKPIKKWQQTIYPGKNHGQIIDAALELHDEFPDRVTTKYLRIASLLAFGDHVNKLPDGSTNPRTLGAPTEDLKEARELFERWRADFAADPTYRGDWIFEALEEDFLAATPEEVANRANFRNLSRQPLSNMLQFISDFQREDVPRLFTLGSVVAPPNLLDYQISVKVARVWSVFLLARGEREAAHRLNMGMYHVGAIGNPPRDFISHLISIAIRAITISGMKDYYLHTPVELEELQQIQADLESVFQESDFSLEKFKRMAQPGWRDANGVFAPWAINWDEADTRWNIVNVQRELLRESIRARLVFLERASWPAVASGTISWSAEDAWSGDIAAPTDPFALPVAPLRAMRDAADLTIYSIGPDRVDDSALVEYDPTNGTVSVGDITTTIQATPRYGFPSRPGYVYQGRADFDRRYPEGLPIDPFSNAGNSALRAMPLSSGDLRIWSWGPDADERSISTSHGATIPLPPEAPNPEPQPHYAPTNGIMSEGDLWVDLPFANP